MFKPVTTLAILIAITQTAFAQTKKKDPVPVKPPDDATIDLIKHRTIKLEEAIKALPAKTPDWMRADVEIYHKAAEWIVRHNEWVTNDAGKWTLAILEQGMQRAADAAQGKAPWREPAGKTVSFAYRSKIDGSVQPYAVTYPLDYGKDPKKKWRLDVVLHGRDGTICEVKFLYQHNGKVAAKDQDYVQLEVYGRGNNAYRWAGETDVFEAMEHLVATEKLLKRDSIDPLRTVLRGFSMGGAGTWHIGLHHPDRFCVIGPGAGFTKTHGYIKNLPNPLPPYEEPLLHIYDAVDYVENAFNLPIVAYSGEIDAQKAAADTIEARMRELKLPAMTHLIAPGLAHQFPPDWQKKAEAEWVKYAGEGKGREPFQKDIRFTTFTLRYHACAWLELLWLGKHYERATTNAIWNGSRIKMTTRNVEAFRINLANSAGNQYRQIEIDGMMLERTDTDTYFKKDGTWKRLVKSDDFAGRFPASKIPGLQGPIDDAFTDAFLCVRGSGTPYHKDMVAAADAQLQRFEKEWDKWMRGKLTIKTDKEVTEDDIKSKHLILFGEWASNSRIREITPFATWDKDHFFIGGQKYDSSKYLPLLISPSPLNGRKYVVLNSGHTFHEADFKGTNALLYPRLGDYAVVRPIPTRQDPAAFEVMKAGIFDDSWKISEK